MLKEHLLGAILNFTAQSAKYDRCDKPQPTSNRNIMIRTYNVCLPRCHLAASIRSPDSGRSLERSGPWVTASNLLASRMLPVL